MAPQDSTPVTSCLHSTLFAQNTGLGGYEVQRPSTAWEGRKSRSVSAQGFLALPSLSGGREEERTGEGRAGLHGPEPLLV